MWHSKEDNMISFPSIW